ncbi:hypothetical protein [Arthrobacter sp. QXT-31]|nr:hypothetical protein [Arthrobacter sp. QXT-31]
MMKPNALHRPGTVMRVLAISPNSEFILECAPGSAVPAKPRWPLA